MRKTLFIIVVALLLPACQSRSDSPLGKVAENQGKLRSSDAKERVAAVDFFVNSGQTGVDILSAVLGTDEARYLCEHWIEAGKKQQIKSYPVTLEDPIEEIEQARKRANEYFISHMTPTPLIKASRQGFSETVKLILDKQDMLKIRNPDEIMQALVVAHIYGHYDAVALLLKEGDNSLADMALSRGVWTDDEKLVRMALQSGADINRTDPTLLHRAARESSLPVVRLLIENGAKVNERDWSGGYYPVHYAILYNTADVVKFLIDSGADFKTYFSYRYIVKGTTHPGELYFDEDFHEYDDWAPIHFAAWAGKPDVIKMLLAKGFKSDTLSKIEKISPLHIAALRGSTQAASVLVDAGADVKLTPDRSFKTPLHFAAISGNTGIATLLLSRGAERDAKDEYDHTALYFAVKYNRVDITRFLVNEGADINTKDEDGRTPLDIAEKEGHKEMIEILLKHGAKTGKGLQEEGK